MTMCHPRFTLGAMETLTPAQLETLWDWAETGGSHPQDIGLRGANSDDPAGMDAIYAFQGGAAIRIREDGDIIGLVPNFNA